MVGLGNSQGYRWLHSRPREELLVHMGQQHVSPQGMSRQVMDVQTSNPDLGVCWAGSLTRD